MEASLSVIVSRSNGCHLTSISVDTINIVEFSVNQKPKWAQA